jgi:molecular chaperone GrpE
MDKKIENKKISKKQEKTDPKDQKITELTNDLKRVQADFSNKCKQVDKEKQSFIEYASASFICKILPIIDELEIALKNMKNSDDKKGIQMTLNKLKKILSDEGVTSIKCIGEKFDPHKHEVLQSEQGKEEGTVLEELQKGYEIKGKVLRSSKVKISRLSSIKPEGEK